MSLNTEQIERGKLNIYNRRSKYVYWLKKFTSRKRRRLQKKDFEQDFKRVTKGWAI